MVQMTPSLDINVIWSRETFYGIWVKFRCHDVTWRHVTSFLKYSLKKCWRLQKYSKKCLYSLFKRCRLVIAFQRGVNHFQRISGSIVVGFLVFVGFWWRHRQKWRHQQKMTSHPNFFLQKKNILLCSIILTSFKSKALMVQKLDGVGSFTYRPLNGGVAKASPLNRVKHFSYYIKF